MAAASGTVVDGFDDVMVRPPNPPKPKRLAAIPARLAKDEFRLDIRELEDDVDEGSSMFVVAEDPEKDPKRLLIGEVEDATIVAEEADGEMALVLVVSATAGGGGSSVSRRAAEVPDFDGISSMAVNLGTSADARLLHRPPLCRVDGCDCGKLPGA